MSPMVRQDTAELLDEYLDVVRDFSLDEVTTLATSELFDSSKLVMDNGLDLPRHSQEPVAEAQQATPQEYLVSADTQPGSPEILTLHSLTPEPFLMQPITSAPSPAPQQQSLIPESYIIQVQPASPFAQPQVQDNVIHFDIHPSTPEVQTLQTVPPEPFLQECLTPAATPQQVLSPHPCTVQGQPISPQQLDLTQLSASLELVPSPSDSILLSPASMSQQEEEEAASPANAPKKRGRKRKYPEGMAPSRRRPRKTKVYEMAPLPDEEAEKKRKNAINAKRHRDMQKEQKNQLAEQLNEATLEVMHLQQQVQQYKQREQQLLQMLNTLGVKVNTLNKFEV